MTPQKRLPKNKRPLDAVRAPDLSGALSERALMQIKTDSRHLAAIVESSDDAIVSKDLNGIVTSWNPGAERLFGIPAAEIVGSSIMRIIPPDRQNEETHILAEIRAGRHVQHFETIRLRHGGAPVDVSITASPIKNVDGQVIGVSKVARDIRERKRVDAEVRRQQAMLLTERELTLDGILVVDGQSKVLSYNGRFAKMWGLSADILATQADEQLLRAVRNTLTRPDEFMERVRQLYDRHDEASNDEVELTDGRVLERYSAPMRDGSGAYYGRIWYFRDVTDRKQSERALRLERDKARRYLDTACVILVGLNTEGLITLVNRHACEALGWTAEELVGRNFLDTCVPTRLREGTRQRLKVAEQGDGSPVSNEILTRSGGERLIEWRTTLLKNDADELTGSLSSGTDITDRTLAAAALGEERDRAQRYLDTADVMLLALDVEGRITSINRKGCELLGWSEPELIGHSWIDTCLPPRIRKALSGKFDALTHGDLSTVENPVQTRAGDERLIEWQNHVVRDETGHVTGTFSSGADITERNAAVEALRVTEERMRFALTNAGVGIWDMDYTTGVARMSEILERLYGLEPGGFGGTFEDFVQVVHPDDRPALLETLQSAARSGEDFSTLHRTIWPDGTVRWLSNAGRIHLGKNGQPVRGVGISLDVTERRILEEQYHQAQKMEAVGRLAGGVAHDFNNLLTAILGYCQLLLADLDPRDPRRADINEIHSAGESAARLTRQLLTFSRKQVIEPRLLHLNEVVTSIRGLLGRLIGEDVKIAVSVRPDLAPVMADPGQMEQVVLNLAMNARDAMPNGGTITIETANVELDEHYASRHFSVKPGWYVVLTVSDTGSGMTAEVQSRLFEPFFTTKEAGKGTGLGLATVHGIVIRCGGSVAVYSEVGRGTTFKVYLPRAAASTATHERPRPVAEPRAAGETVLVVEDADGLRDLAKRMLERQGYKVLLASNASEALRQFDHTPSIDVILTDVIMPGGSGPELTRQLVSRRPGLKVIYMSGYTEDAITHHGVLDPGIAFIHKPFTAERLGQKIREVLDH
jgi:two-component system cell cycle sensor histidine kinase/response regulator CckA